MTTDEGINYDRDMLGKEFPIGTFEISREMILEFSPGVWRGQSHLRR